jgi:hypothetical protein
MSAIRPDDKFLPLRNPGSKGWNAFDEPASIDDLELADVQNISYDDGYIRPRQGSTLLYGKPDGETGDPLQLIRAQTSDGLRYLIAVYGAHFYVRHPGTDEWIRINQTYAPTQTDKHYGYIDWNNGRGDDRLYVCNGVDDFARWDMCVGVVDGSGADVAATAASLTLEDGSRFPSGGGTLILKKKSDGTLFTEAYASRTGNVFTLTGTLSFDIEDGSPCVTDMIQKSGMEVGKHVSKHQQRLVAANYYGGETVAWFSVQGDPEDFTLASTIAGAFTQTIADGNGEITGVHDFGQFLVIEKEGSFHSLSLKIADDLGSKLAVVSPLVSGESVGPLGMPSTLKVMSSLYFPTRSNGFISIFPETSGDSSSVSTKPLSQKIDPFLRRSVELGYARGAAAANKAYWAVALKGSTQNTLVLAYDLLRNAWTKHFGWAAKDLLEIDSEVLYLDSGTGEVFQIENGEYNDNGNGYLSSATFKRFDYGEMGRPKNQDHIYVQGLMTSASEFYIDIHFNEDGVLGRQTFRINKDTPNLYRSSPLTDEQGNFVLGTPIMGMSGLQGIPDVSMFRCYLAIDVTKSFYNIQPRVYGTRAAFWGITGMAMNPQLLPITPQGFVVAPLLSE